MIDPIGWIREKLNPAQENIVDDFGTDVSPSVKLATNQDAYNKLEVVNRGVNLIVDSGAGIKMDIGESKNYHESPARLRVKKLDTLLNFRPNPFYNADTLKRLLLMDLILEGDAFMYWDGAFLYHMPAYNVDIISDTKTYIKQYEYADKVFKPSEIIHIKENSGDSVFDGSSRLDAATDTMNLLLSMQSYQSNFFDNSAVPGIVLTTPNPLSEKVKNRLIQKWISAYNPNKGGKRPMIIDGEFKLESLSKYNFKELDFNESIKVLEEKILKTLGVPSILLESGNNANINPNLRMFYITTVLPLVERIIQAIELYFGYDIKPIKQDILALTPELRDWSNFLSTLVNAGIITRNEARQELRREDHEADFADELILPANIAGSASDSTVGGRPSDDSDGDDSDGG